jgi:tetratricopeptide (TPR) repeat protein
MSASEQVLDRAWTAIRDLESQSDGEPVEAAQVELLELYVRHRPDHALARYLLGKALRELGRHEESVVELRASSELDAEDDDEHDDTILVHLALSLNEAGRWDEAEQVYAEACDVPDNAELGYVWSLRAANLMQLERWDEAAKYLIHAQRLPECDQDEAGLLLGKVCIAQQRYDQAKVCLQKVRDRDPEDSEAATLLESLEWVRRNASLIDELRRQSVS